MGIALDSMAMEELIKEIGSNSIDYGYATTIIFPHVIQFVC
jgi:hypothetical protein